ncbi:hypothetical protein NKH77_40130 [Streptomyces sp. M19]
MLDESRDEWDRVRAIVALGNVKDRKAGDVLARAVGQRSEKIRIESAIVLSSRHMATHRALLEELTSTWPKDAPFPRSVVLEALERTEERPESRSEENR